MPPADDFSFADPAGAVVSRERPSPRPAGSAEISVYRRRRRDLRLQRLTLYCVILGAVITVLAPGLAGADWSRVWPALGFGCLALAGALLLDRLPWLGMLAMLLAAGLSAQRGNFWIVPGSLLGAGVAAHRSRAALRLVGYLLLIPGIAALHLAAMASISLLSGLRMPGLPDALNPPLGWPAALQSLWLLPLALAGAWILTDKRK